MSRKKITPHGNFFLDYYKVLCYVVTERQERVMDFIEKLDLLMIDNGLNKHTFSKQCGIPYTTVDAFYKKGTDNVKLSTLKKIAAFFDVSLDYIGDDDVTEKNYNASVQKISSFQSERLEYIIKVTGKDDISELASQVRVDIMTFTHWLTGQAQPSQENIESLARILGVTCDYLMGLTDDPKESVVEKEIEQALLDSFRFLNEDGQEKVIDYIDDLVNSGKYIKRDLPKTTHVFRAARSKNNAAPQIRDMSPEREKEFEEVDETDEI